MKFFPLIAFILFSFLSSSVQAQVKSSGNSLRNDLQKIISGYSSGFADLRGEVLAENPQSIDFASLVKPEGSQESIITQYSSKNNPVYSWQAVMFTAEDFGEASKKYKSLFTQVKGMTIKLNDDYTFSLKGDYEAPDESKKFCSSILTLLPAGNPLQKLKIEISMQYEFPEWKLTLMVYEREREDNEKGKTRD